jgi:hypothetical protein
MVGLDETAVLRWAKAVAAQDGFTWELDFAASDALRVPLRGQRFLSEDRGQEYLAQARSELGKETGDA